MQALLNELMKKLEPASQPDQLAVAAAEQAPRRHPPAAASNCKPAYSFGRMCDHSSNYCQPKRTKYKKILQIIKCATNCATTINSTSIRF